MARGFLSGVLWGGVLAVGTGGVASVLAPPPMPPQVSDAAPGAAATPERIAGASGGETGSAGDTTVVTVPVTPQAQAPDPDTLGALDEGTTTSTERPRTGAADALGEPVETASASGVTVDAESPVLPNPQALAPMEPQEADDVSISTEPAQPATPQSPEVEGAFDTPEQPQTAATEEIAVSDPVASEVGDPVASETTTVEPAETSQEAVTETETTPVETAPETQEQTIETTQATGQVTPDPEDPPEVIVTAPQAPEQPETSQEVGAAQQTASARPTIGEPAGTLTDRDTGVVIRRPGAATLGESDDGTDAEVVAEAQAPEDPRPVRRFAQDFDAPEDKPLMSIVLIDDGTSPVAGAAGIAALQSFPYALSFAVDAMAPDAAERMATYRAAGFEVLAMVDLPEGARPQDAETTLGAVLPKLPEVVGVLEGTDGGLQQSREVSDQVTSILLQSGHGLLTQNRGLNTMPQLARREGVPAEPVFRDFDSKGQTAQVIRRFLDQAAFKAGQEGAVVMLGRMRPDTISALLLWGLQDRASSVALAPISAVLLREE